jgi:hypothetical protein
MMHVYLASDPAKGNVLDFSGMMAAYTQFCGTKEQPNEPARCRWPPCRCGPLVEIEVMAVRTKYSLAAITSERNPKS